MISTIVIITLGIFVILLLFRQKRNINLDYKKMHDEQSKILTEYREMYHKSMKLNFELTRKILELTKEKEENPDE